MSLAAWEANPGLVAAHWASQGPAAESLAAEAAEQVLRASEAWDSDQESLGKPTWMTSLIVRAKCFQSVGGSVDQSNRYECLGSLIDIFLQFRTASILLPDGPERSKANA